MSEVAMSGTQDLLIDLRLVPVFQHAVGADQVCPRTALGLHRHRAGRLAGKEGQNVVPPQLSAEQDCSRGIGSVNLKNALRQI
jgi:hypothetical protein